MEVLQMMAEEQAPGKSHFRIQKNSKTTSTFSRRAFSGPTKKSAVPFTSVFARNFRD
jgi:hypothetical protein